MYSWRSEMKELEMVNTLMSSVIEIGLMQKKYLKVKYLNIQNISLVLYHHSTSSRTFSLKEAKEKF